MSIQESLVSLIGSVVNLLQFQESLKEENNRLHKALEKAAQENRDLREQFSKMEESLILACQRIDYHLSSCPSELIEDFDEEKFGCSNKCNNDIDIITCWQEFFIKQAKDGGPS